MEVFPPKRSELVEVALGEHPKALVGHFAKGFQRHTHSSEFFSAFSSYSQALEIVNWKKQASISAW